MLHSSGVKNLPDRRCVGDSGITGPNHASTFNGAWFIHDLLHRSANQFLPQTKKLVPMSSERSVTLVSGCTVTAELIQQNLTAD
jgi:hypothetical protein